MHQTVQHSSPTVREHTCMLLVQVQGCTCVVYRTVLALLDDEAKLLLSQVPQRSGLALAPLAVHERWVPGTRGGVH
jgi:predicted nucleotidyltransferase